nr:putative F-box/LRR-repeat protein At3g18150 [Coffea arabica]
MGCLQDWISQLPDDVLMIILSSLLMREAARTRVLSHRWRKLWKHFTGSLDFDASDTLRLIAHLEVDRVTEARRYRDWVDQVVVSHEGSSFKGLRIAFVLGKSNVAALNKWLYLAIVKRVQRLELDLSSADGGVGCTDSSFTFPSWLLHLNFLDFTSFDRLTSLCLKSISITEDDLAYFLSKCSLLEQLTVENAAYLHKVRVAARQSLKLKHLEIRYCLKLEDVEVSARSVASFKCAGPMININVPEFSSISLAVEYCEMLFVKFPRIWSFSGLQQLELKLNLRMMEPSRSMSFPKDIPELSELKQLELKFRVPADHSILFLSSIIRASPRLLKLILKCRVEWFWPLETETLRSLEDCEKGVEGASWGKSSSEPQGDRIRWLDWTGED